ncbi:hypothetical protein KZZ52_20805 [Dactylosporangium sp. AC04546]|uniref:hypothetical protein n=1 Tax=Dactylosporangium sp. AC04546 TaxID=2862460 RepID=UPI001EDF73FC|nr:hypothetical protein [Dactylosporangium sp. AC04546]WVK87730.1 hypothetical protein KZZ52_20805 [Dactylosporangium sp. AC04546]
MTHGDASNPTPSTEGAFPVPTTGPDPGYPRNASGETYGSAAEAWSPDQEPDLILVMFGRGQQGYVKKKDLDPPKFTNPHDAIEWSRQNASKPAQVLTVYESDGMTAIGTFTLSKETA